MDEVKRIYGYLGNTEKTLVFTSETAAENALWAYINQYQGKAVFKDRCMSWDSFFLSLLDTKGRKSATRTDRKVFAYSFLKNGGLKRLKYFASSAYPESTLAYSSSISSLLPYFPSPEDPVREHMPNDMLLDADILRASYMEFLERKGLYEKNYLTPDYSKIEKDRYVFVFPATFTSSKVQSILNLGIVEVIESPSSQDTSLLEYPNSISEIRWTLRDIEEKRKKYKDDEIAITSSSLSTYRPYLESEAKKRDIPLVFTSSSPLSSFPEGRFLHQLYSTVISRWSFDETKKLVLDPRFPFKDRTKMVSILRHGVDRKMEDKGIRSWLRVLDKDEKEFFLSLISSTERIVKSRKSLLTLALIQDYRDKFFEEGKWNEKDDRVFGSALEILEAMGDEEIDNLFKLFLSLLDETEYVEKSEERKGIRVYSYPASSGLIIPVHYVIGLDDRTTEREIDDYPFLVSLSRPEAEEISSSILSVYRSSVFSPHLVISGTTDGFDGARLLPHLFLGSSEKNSREICDGYTEERSLWIENASPKTPAYSAQSNGYRKAVKAALKGRMEEVKAAPFTSENLSISVSSMKSWDMCPYRGYAAVRLRLEEKKFKPELEDPLVIGNILHDTIEKSLEEAGTIGNIDIERMQARFEDNLKRAYEKHLIPTLYSWAHMRGRFIGKFDALQESNKAGFYLSLPLEENEKTIRNYPLTGNITIKGRIDTILYDKDSGDKYIIDWKTTGKYDYSSDLEEVSLQVILYSVLLEDEVKGGAFYSFSEGEYKVIWPEVEYAYRNCSRKGTEGFSLSAMKAEIAERLRRIRYSLENGDYSPTYTDHSCTLCPYERLCRARFVASKEESND